jgi:drug/metabolite transporter (DMT)-like permease
MVALGMVTVPISMLYFVAIRSLNPVAVGSLSLGYPFVAALLGLLIFGTPVGWVQIVTITAVVLAVCLELTSPETISPREVSQ